MSPQRVRAAAGLCLAVILSAAITGCGTTGVRTAGGGLTPRLSPYEGPRARLAVTRFDHSAARGGWDVGEGLAAMMTTELVNSGRFIVLERDYLQDVLREQDLASEGRVAPETAAPSGEVTGAELLVTGTVNTFQPNRLGWGGIIMGGVSFIGSAILHEENENIPIVAASYRESFLAADIRLLDTATSRVLASMTVEGRALDWGGGIIFEVGGGRGRVPVALGGWQKTSVEKALRIAIARAVEGIVSMVPVDYYRHTRTLHRDGELMGYTYLEFYGRPSPEADFRRAVRIEDQGEMERLLREWGIGYKLRPGSVDFTEEVVIAAVGSEEDRGIGLSIQKVVNDPDAQRVEIAVLPPPETAVGEEDQGDEGEGEPGIPFFFARTPRTGRPLRVFWMEISGPDG